MRREESNLILNEEHQKPRHAWQSPYHSVTENKRLQD